MGPNFNLICKLFEVRNLGGKKRVAPHINTDLKSLQRLGSHSYSIYNPKNRKRSFSTYTSLDTHRFNFKDYNSYSYKRVEKYSTAKNPEPSDARIANTTNNPSCEEVVSDGKERLMQSINQHMKDYCELIDALNRVEVTVYRSPLIFVEREADKTRAVLERALVCAHGVSGLKELNLKMPKVLRNKLTVMDTWPDFKQYRDENWENRVPGTPINRSFENLYSNLERNVICYRTGLPSIYPEYYYEQLAISTICFTALADVLGVRYENSEIVSSCLSAEI